MERIPEPELMDSLDQAEAYARGDFEEPHSLFVEKFKEVFPDFNGKGIALDLGCGPADISIRMARAYPHLLIHGVDGADAMLKFGRQDIAAAGLEKRVLLFKGYVPEISLPRKDYDVIFSNSLLHHLHQPQELWQTAHSHGKTSARIFVVDLLRPESKGEAESMVSTYTADEPGILKRDFYNSLLASFTLEEVEIQLAEAGLDNQMHVEQFSDRHFVVHGEMV